MGLTKALIGTLRLTGKYVDHVYRSNIFLNAEESISSMVDRILESRKSDGIDIYRTATAYAVASV